jgi:hypothetical protein
MGITHDLIQGKENEFNKYFITQKYFNYFNDKLHAKTS